MGGPLRPGFEPLAIGPRAIHALAGQPHFSPPSPSRTQAMGEDHAETKDALRRRLRAARGALPPRVAAELGAATCARVLGLPAFMAARAVVAYAPVEHEVDPGTLVAAALAAGKPVYYPRRTAGDLEFLECGPADLARGSGTIPEPRGGTPLSGATTAGVVFLVP